MEKLGVEDTIKEIADELERIATTKTVVGDPITAAGKTIIPISRISLGFGAGGGEGKRDTESGYAGGGGAGAKIEPVAFIMLSEEEARIFRISERHDAGSIINSIPELVPEIMDKLKGMRGKKNEDKTQETVVKEKVHETVVKEKEVPGKETVEEKEIKIEEKGCFH